MTRLPTVRAESEVCAVEHLWPPPQQKSRRLWLRRIIDPYHKSSDNRSDKEKHCYFHSTVQSHEGGAAVQTQQLQRVTQTPAWHVCHSALLQDRSSCRACCERRSGPGCVIRLFGLNSIGKWLIRRVLLAPRQARLCSSLHAFERTVWGRARCPHSKRMCNIQAEGAAHKNPRGEKDEYTGGNLGTPTWSAPIQARSSRKLCVNLFDSCAKEPFSCFLICSYLWEWS